MASVVKRPNTLGCEPSTRAFESRHSPHNLNLTPVRVFFLRSNWFYYALIGPNNGRNKNYFSLKIDNKSAEYPYNYGSQTMN